MGNGSNLKPKGQYDAIKDHPFSGHWGASQNLSGKNRYAVK